MGKAYFIVLEIVILCWEAHESLCVDGCCEKTRVCYFHFGQVIPQPYGTPTLATEPQSSHDEPLRVLVSLAIILGLKEGVLSVTHWGSRNNAKKRIWNRERLRVSFRGLHLSFPTYSSWGNGEMGRASLYFKINCKIHHLWSLHWCLVASGMTMCLPDLPNSASYAHIQTHKCIPFWIKERFLVRHECLVFTPAWERESRSSFNFCFCTVIRVTFK